MDVLSHARKGQLQRLRLVVESFGKLVGVAGKIETLTNPSYLLHVVRKSMYGW